MTDLDDIAKQINAELADTFVELNESSILRFESRLTSVARRLFDDAERIIDLYFEIRDEEIGEDVDTMIEQDWSAVRVKSTLIDCLVRAVSELDEYAT